MVGELAGEGSESAAPPPPPPQSPPPPPPPPATTTTSTTISTTTTTTQAPTPPPVSFCRIPPSTSGVLTPFSLSPTLFPENCVGRMEHMRRKVAILHSPLLALSPLPLSSEQQVPCHPWNVSQDMVLSAVLRTGIGGLRRHRHNRRHLRQRRDFCHPHRRQRGRHQCYDQRLHHHPAPLSITHQRRVAWNIVDHGECGTDVDQGLRHHHRILQILRLALPPSPQWKPPVIVDHEGCESEGIVVGQPERDTGPGLGRLGVQGRPHQWSISLQCHYSRHHHCLRSHSRQHQCPQARCPALSPLLWCIRLLGQVKRLSLARYTVTTKVTVIRDGGSFWARIPSGFVLAVRMICLWVLRLM